LHHAAVARKVSVPRALACHHRKGFSSVVPSQVSWMKHPLFLCHRKFGSSFRNETTVFANYDTFYGNVVFEIFCFSNMTSSYLYCGVCSIFDKYKILFSNMTSYQDFFLKETPPPREIQLSSQVHMNLLCEKTF
jgi:hypothetical protein